MNKLFITVASITGGLGVILGAFGAHALKAKLTPEQLQPFETGVKYQFYHTFALIAIALLAEKYSSQSSLLNLAGYFFIAGIVLFSGSLYMLATRSLYGGESWTWLGPLTPIGGLSFVIGWCMLLWISIKN